MRSVNIVQIFDYDSLCDNRLMFQATPSITGRWTV